MTNEQLAKLKEADNILIGLQDEAERDNRWNAAEQILEVRRPLTKLIQRGVG